MEEELNITKQISIIPSMMIPKRMVRRHPHQRIGRRRSQDSVEEKPTGIHRDDRKGSGSPPTRRRMSRLSSGRRSSLFSLDEGRQSLVTAQQRPSLTPSSDISLTPSDIEHNLSGSLQGSFSGTDHLSSGNSLICSFGRMNSAMDSSFNTVAGGSGNNNSLICGWDRQQSIKQLANIKDGVVAKGNGNDKSLICGWDHNSSEISVDAMNVLQLMHSEYENEDKLFASRRSTM